LTDDEIDAQAGQLLSSGATSWTDTSGKRIMLFYASVVGVEAKEFVLVREGGGSLFFDFSRPLNPYRLVTAGFQIGAAVELVHTVHRIFLAVSARENTTKPS